MLPFKHKQGTGNSNNNSKKRKISAPDNLEETEEDNHEQDVHKPGIPSPVFLSPQKKNNIEPS